MALQSELNAVLNKLSGVAPEPVLAPQEPVAASVTPELVPVTPTAVEPKVETPAPVVAKVEPDVDKVVDSWDTPSSPVTAPLEPHVKVDVPYFDLSEVAKVLQTEVKSKDDLLRVVREFKEQAEQVKSEKATLPQELLKAIEIAKQNGNYLEYLKVSQVDWSKKDPIEAYEEYVVEKLTDPATGQVDYEKADGFLDKIDDVEKEFRGKELIANMANYQRHAQAAIEREAVETRKMQDTNLRKALEGLEDVSGFKLNQSHKDELYNWYTSGQMFQDMFHDETGNIDFKKLVTNGFISKYWGKIDSFRKQQIKNANKREILEELQQPSLTTSTETVQTEPTQGYSLADYLKELKKQKGFN